MKTQGFVPLLAGKARVCGAADFFPRDLAASWWKRSFHARLPSKPARWSCAQKTFVRASFKICKLKMWTRGLPWRCENEAFVRESFKICKLKLCNGSLCEISFKTCKLKMWKRSFRARHPSKTALCSDDGFAFLSVIFLCGHSFFAAIFLCSHCSLQSLFLQSLCFAVMVLCGHGSLLCWKPMHRREQQKDLSRTYTYKHETVDGQEDQILQTPTK